MEINKLQKKWTLIIRPQRAWWDLQLGEIWRYRDLILLFVWRDFVAYYKQTILGPLWYLIQPILTTVVFTVIFGNIAKLPTDGLPPFLFYLAGNTVWVYFSTCVTSTSDTFAGNAAVFGKVYFPRLSVPISIVISNLISFGIRLGVFLAFLVYFMLKGAVVHVTWWALLLPVLLIIMAGLGLGFGIIISSMTTKYRDLQQLVGFGVQLMMYGTPVIYPLSSVDAGLRWLLLLNPMTPVVEVFRFAFLGTSALEPVYLVYSFLCMLTALVIGIVAFNHVENTFMDTV
ncbi:ABC transporter permease [Candidatus Villigracilis saccharophilus]|uniref:ABC transporter permease n=1 Tax=Candidatus Villigracilis saccharophilus TaxID=3140684 RepID=UPI0031347569|nr:ABC transporter permease [Anaerolineales bacterium]